VTEVWNICDMLRNGNRMGRQKGVVGKGVVVEKINEGVIIVSEK